MSNELSNDGGADRQPPLDDPGSFGAPSRAIDDHLTCFTPKRSLVRARPRTASMRSATSAWFDVGQGCNALDAVALDEPRVGSPDRVVIHIERS